MQIYFDYIFVHLRQKVRLRPELGPKFSSTLRPNPAQTRPKKPGPTYNSVLHRSHICFSYTARNFAKCEISLAHGAKCVDQIAE